MKMFKRMAILLLVLAVPVFAQNGADAVHLFQSFFFDAPITPVPYVNAGLQFDSYDGFSSTFIGAQGGYGINEKIEVDAQFGFQMWKPENGDGESGITDLNLYGRYNLVNSESPTKISAGAMVTLPIGSEDIGAGDLNFGGFGALRHALESGITLCANIGLIFFETTTFDFGSLEEKTEYESSFNIGAGAIYPVNDVMSIVGEFLMMSEGDYMALSCGIDYALGGGRVRGAILLGLDDGAPDFGVFGSYLILL